MYYIYKFISFIFSVFPVKKHKIFFLSYYGSQYGCNPKYLSEYIVNKNEGWDVVWGFVTPDKYLIKGVRKVKYMSLRYFYELCTSGVFVTNYRMTLDYHKRKGQVYIQTWHSSTRLKKIEGDVEVALKPNYVKMAKKDSKNIDVLLSGSQFSTETFKRAFWYSGTILPTGTPREDLMFRRDESILTKVYTELRINNEAKIVLYAPTFRQSNSLECYDLDYKTLQDTLKKKFGGNWIVLLRLHPHLREYSKKLTENHMGVVDATQYDDIQELLCASDVVISDYSSLIFDFALTKRPCFIYASDLKDYTDKERELYFNIEDLPFPISRNNEEMVSILTNFDNQLYCKRIDSFLSTLGSYEDGHACERVYNYIKNIR